MAMDQAPALPEPPPLLVRAVAPNVGLRLNAQIPFALESNQPARPFTAGGASDEDRSSALECMSQAIYYEAGSQSVDGMRAVAQVVLNRVRHPAFPGTVCGVVYQGSTRPTGCQFTFTCDGSLVRRPSETAWAISRKVAQAALDGSTFSPVGLATHYHADFVVPYWASSLAKSAVVGAHIFYRWRAHWGRPAAFAKRYTGGEPDADGLKQAALAAIAGRRALANSDGPAGSSQYEAAPLDLKIQLASRTLGANHPEMIALRKGRSALGRMPRRSRSEELTAIEKELAAAMRTLGSRHPRILALEERRAAIGGTARQRTMASRREVRSAELTSAASAAGSLALKR